HGRIQEAYQRHQNQTETAQADSHLGAVGLQVKQTYGDRGEKQGEQYTPATAQDVLDHEPGDVFDDHHAAPLSRIRATADSRCRLSVASFRSRTEPAYCTAPSR